MVLKRGFMIIKQSGYEGLYQLCIGETLSAHNRDNWMRRVSLLMERGLSEREAEILKSSRRLEKRARKQGKGGKR